jgi:hypothetical protein
MGLKQLFRKLRYFLKKPSHDYIPSTMSFLELDIEKIKRNMDLFNIGKKEGKGMNQHLTALHLMT